MGAAGSGGPWAQRGLGYLFGFFEEGKAGALVFGDDIAFRKSVDGARAWSGGEVVEGDRRSAAEGLLAAVEEIGFSVFLAGAAEWHSGFSFGCAA